MGTLGNELCQRQWSQEHLPRRYLKIEELYQSLTPLTGGTLAFRHGYLNRIVISLGAGVWRCPIENTSTKHRGRGNDYQNNSSKRRFGNELPKLLRQGSVFGNAVSKTVPHRQSYRKQPGYDFSILQKAKSTELRMTCSARATDGAHKRSTGQRSCVCVLHCVTK